MRRKINLVLVLFLLLLLFGCNSANQETGYDARFVPPTSLSECH